MASKADQQQVAALIAGREAFVFGDAKELADRLRKHKDFELARQLLAWLTEQPGLDDAQQRWAHQRLAMAWYHDGEHGKGAALTTARELLLRHDAMTWAQAGDAHEDKAEHLAIMGAVAKRRHDVTGRLEDLEESIFWYDAAVDKSRGRDESGAPTGFNDNAYAAINAVFVRELLADLSPTRADTLRSQAAELRADIIADLAPVVATVRAGVAAGAGPGEFTWWHVVTYAEALLGEGKTAEACEAICLFDAVEIEKLGDWERESSARQLARLAAVKRVTDPAVDALLRHLAQCAHDRYAGSLRGTLGLALSGGGFRASLFHLGVLARLAEADLLRYVGALSCVSGGSIVGAHYYRALQEVLDRKPDVDIHRADYVALVRQVITHFCEGVGGNLRGKAFFRPGNLARKLWSLVPTRPRFTRTVRTGELLGELFYARGGRNPRLADLMVHPPGAPGFNPKLHNWRRAAKVPMLVLNATTLNTGNNFQFTATWIGEPDSGYYAGIDALPDVPRRYLDREVPPAYRDLPLSTAVGASACVPGVFPPVALPGLLADDRDRVITLVDGGLQDNQGLGGLIDQDCTHIFVSDASGQLGDRPAPGTLGAGVIMRSSSIQARTIRSGVFKDIDERGQARRLRGAWVVHMTKGLREARAGGRDQPTSYGVPYGVQRRLAELRTDLDRFSESEAQALMLSAYRMTDEALAENPPDFPVDNRREGDWPFLDIGGTIDAVGSERYLELVRELDLGATALLRGVRRLWRPGYKKRCEAA